MNHLVSLIVFPSGNRKIVIIELEAFLTAEFLHKLLFLFGFAHLVELLIPEADFLGVEDIAAVIDFADIGPENGP